MIAVPLSPRARTLIRANRDSARPTPADRERITVALRAQLGVTVLPLDTPASTVPTSTVVMSTGIQRRLAAAFGLCVVGSALFLARRPEPAPEPSTRLREQSVETVPSAIPTAPSTPVSAPPETPPLSPQAVERTSSNGVVVKAQPTTAPNAPQHASTKVASAAVAQDTLAQELALLTSAASQLSSGQASGALQALDEHQRRFSHGVLSDERNVAKARALCMLHRFDEGRALLARLTAGTPAAARVKEECDSSWKRANPSESQAP